MSNIAKTDISLEEKVRHLEKENHKLRKKIERLKKTMDITTRHGDIVTGELEEKVEASVKEIEQRVRLISETIPVPVIISRTDDGKFLYVNDHSCQVFGLSSEEFMKIKAPDIYLDADDRKIFIKKLTEQKRVNDFEVRFKKSDGSMFWAALFSQPMMFKNESCLLTVVYDLTERKHAEEEIRRLNEKLDQREIKYLMFILDGEEYGIEIINVREIVSMMPITAIAEAPPYMKGVINLRDRVIPVTDLRLRLEMKPAAYTNQTCIIIIESGDETNKTLKGIIVDAVSDVRGLRANAIEPPPEMSFKTRSEFISGIAKTENDIKILLNSSRL